MGNCGRLDSYIWASCYLLNPSETRRSDSIVSIVRKGRKFACKTEKSCKALFATHESRQ